MNPSRDRETEKSGRNVMPLMPFAMLWIWFRGVLALMLLGGGIWLLYTW